MFVALRPSVRWLMRGCIELLHHLRAVMDGARNRLRQLDDGVADSGALSMQWVVGNASRAPTPASW